MGESPRKTQAFKVVLQKNYGTYTAGSTISLFGMWAHKLAAAWLAWSAPPAAPVVRGHMYMCAVAV